MSQPILLDVARLAGVSRATAARVLAGHGRVGEELAGRVRAAADELGYRTNHAARALRRGRTGAVAILVTARDPEWLVGQYVGDPLRAASQALLDGALQPVLLPNDGEDLDRLIAHLGGGRVDAAIVVQQTGPPGLHAALDGLGIPIVYVGRPTADVTDAHVVVETDQHGGGRLAARTLLEAGRRRLVTLAGPTSYAPSDHRLAGFLAECEAWGVEPVGVERGDFGVESGVEGTQRLLAARPDLDGVVAANDLMAVGALRALAAAGRAVPADVSVIGFDDGVVAATSDPPLTTVRQPFAEQGTAAAELVLALLGEGDGESDGGVGAPSARAARGVAIPTTLTVRASV